VFNTGRATGRSVRIEQFGSPNYVVTSDVLPIVDAGSTLTINLIAVPRDSTLQPLRGINAWRIVVEDLWDSAHSVTDSKSRSEVYGKLIDAIMNEQLLVPLQLVYQDLSGRDFRSPCTVVWCPMLNVVEIRQGVIVKGTRPLES